ncbi:hypothetical protein [Bartonella jaculi]|uniref:Uncharacterized protein n=1 Tax=Bartonella jaculi TaxID=686226 RepID=A0ABP9N285_9HYPH
MKMIYFITAYATFASISMAQAASLIGAQKLVEGIFSSKSSLFDAQIGNPLGEVLRTKFCNHQRGQAAQLVPVASSSNKKRRGPPRGGKKRPNLFTKSPMSF